MSDGLRILITTDADKGQGAPLVPHAYATQIEFLRRTGNEVYLFGVDDRTSPPGILRNIRELRRVVVSFKPDVIVAYYGTMVAAISRLAAGRIALVVTFRGSDLMGTSNPGWKWRLRDRLGRMLSLWAAGGARRVIVNGDGLLHALPNHLRRKAHNIPNGVNIEVFSPLAKDEARRRLGWAIDEKVILFYPGVGSGQVVKNRPLAEKVVSLLALRFPKIRLEQTGSYEKREDIVLSMNACDCLLVTSLHEGSPDLVKEALACDLPVVSVPCGDVPERLQDVSFSSIQPYDPNALADAVEQVLHNDCRSNGRSRLFSQGLDIPSVTERVLAVYRQAAGA